MFKCFKCLRDIDHTSINIVYFVGITTTSGTRES